MMMTMTSFSVHHKLVGCFDSAMLWILELSVYTKMMYLSSCHLKETETSSSVVFGLVFNLAILTLLPNVVMKNRTINMRSN